jgi:hypothetical protein
MMSYVGVPSRRFTPEEDMLLVELRLKFPGCDPGKSGWNKRGGQRCYGLATIAQMLGRAKSSVQLRLEYLARRDEAFQIVTSDKAELSIVRTGDTDISE